MAEDEQQVTEISVPETPAGAQNTEQPAEHWIPKSRFDTVNNELKAVKAKLTEFETAQMTETQKLKAQADTATAQMQTAQTALRQARAEVVVATAAAKQGLDAGLLLRLIDLEFNEAGDPINVDAAITTVLKQYPQLKPTAAQMGATNPNRTAKLSMEDVKRMTPAEINARWDEVQAAMSGK